MQRPRISNRVVAGLVVILGFYNSPQGRAALRRYGAERGGSQGLADMERAFGYLDDMWTWWHQRH